MKIIELILDEEGTMAVDAISAVSAPAIESNFIYLSKDGKPTKGRKVELAEVSKEKRLLMGAALIPNKLILRRDETTGEKFYIFFSQKTVRDAMEIFLKKGNQSNITEEHEKKVEGVTVVESWLKEDMTHDKSAKYGLNDPVGTWMVTMKAENGEIYEKAKSGELNGFSIEAQFADRFQYEQIKADEADLISKIMDILSEEDE